MIPASRSIARIPHLSAFMTREGEAVVGWGRKRSGERARELAVKKGEAWLLLEDGFLRSVEREASPLSLVIDDLGIYYDSGSPSKLEHLIRVPLSDEQKARTHALIESWKKGRVSKYNHAREYEGQLPDRYVLVCDQTFGDASIQYGQADEASFARMLKAALVENPDRIVVVKTHPDALTRGKRGHFDAAAVAKHPRILLIASNCHPVRLIEQAEAVYVVTSQMGFEALIWGKRVRTFGMPFYAGWGLTEDELPTPARRGGASLEQLVHAALVRYPRYVDPETGQRCEVERTLSYIAFQRQMRMRFPASVYAVGFSRWKRPILGRFLSGSEVHFLRRAEDIATGATAVLWGRDEPIGLPPTANRIRVEDGFLRSVGLGADLTQPVSWICDDVGLYYDASHPSRLEHILAETAFDEPLLARAWTLRQMICDAGLTKYNLGASPATSTWRRPDGDRSVILVPGQVEDDASIRYGAPGLSTNLGLLRAVRKANPYAHIVYKPHPDVVAGLRAKGEGESDVADFCNEIVMDGDMAHLLEEVEEVATLTSLAGFEALMRGKRVTCYGQPFYAGWGLTRDMAPIARRTRRLTLDELVAGVLILYPTYVSRVTEQFTTPEQAVEELIAWRETGGGSLPLWRRVLRPAFRAWKSTMSRGGGERRHPLARQMEATDGGR